MRLLNFTKDCQMKVSISYCVTVWNESRELDLLINQLIKFLDENDEIVIQGDQGKVTEEVVSVVRKHLRNPQVKYIEYPLNKDFASFKNNLIKNVIGDYIFQIDADELVSTVLLENLKFLLLENPTIELFRVPRLNIVQGLLNDQVKQWGWRKDKMLVDKLDYATKDILEKYGLGTDFVFAINFPDRQNRLFKKVDSIRWKNKVHEVIEGMKSYADFPDNDFDYCLFHVKTSQRQISQNKFYETI